MAAKFCGSGGAIVIVPGFSYKEDVIEALEKEMKDNGFVMVKVHVHEPNWIVCLRKGRVRVFWLRLSRGFSNNLCGYVFVVLFENVVQS